MAMEKESNKGAGRQMPLSARGGGLAFSAAVTINLIISLIASVIIGADGIAGTDAAKYISYLVSPVAIAITLAVALCLYKQPARRIMPVRCSPKYYLIGLMLIFGLLFSLSSLNEYLIKLFELMGYERRQSTLPDLSGWNLLPAIVVIAVLPAALEEILFRGIVLNNIEEETGSVASVFLVGLIFSLYHASVEQTIYQFICGCLFTLLSVRSRSVAPAVLIHFINNAVILVFGACGLLDANGNLVLSQGWEIGLTVASALSLAGAVVWLVLDKKVRFGLYKQQKGGVKNFFIFASVGIAVTALSWILGLFV